MASGEGMSLSLDYALAYAKCGVRVLPILPGTKRPPMREWVTAATTDHDIIRSWFTGMYAKCGVGLAMGRQPDGRFVFALDVDEHDVAHSGGETLAELQRAYGKLPDTVRLLTGSGGLHLLFTAPAGVEVRNGLAGDGLDVRGEGGQIVVAPSIHPTTGRRYECESGFAPWEHDIAAASGWLLDIVKVAPAVTSTDRRLSAPTSVDPQGMFGSPDTPADWLRSRWDWPLQLRDAGWVEHHTRGDEVHWTRPGKDRREGPSGVLHMPDGPLVIFSSDASMGGLHAVGHINRDGSVSLSPFQFYAVHRHGGDLSAAGRAVGMMMEGRSPDAPTETGGDDDEPFFIDAATLFSDAVEEEAIVDGLVYPGRWTAIGASAKQGKSTLIAHMAQRKARGLDPFDGSACNRVRIGYIDGEMGRSGHARPAHQVRRDRNRPPGVPILHRHSAEARHRRGWRSAHRMGPTTRSRLGGHRRDQRAGVRG